MASGWGLTYPRDEERPPEGSGKAVQLQYIWLEVMSLSDCNEVAARVNKMEKCKLKGLLDENVISNVTLCVSAPANPKRTVEKGE